MSGLSTAVKYEGFVDAIENGVVFGWAWNPDEPEERIEVDILHSGVLLATVQAGNYRADLMNMDLGDGNHSFEYQLPQALNDASAAEFAVQYAGTKFPLPRVTGDVRRLVQRSQPARGESEIIAALEERISSQDEVIADMTVMLRGLIVHLRTEKSNLPTIGNESAPDDARITRELLEEQANRLVSMETYLTNFGKSLRDISEKQSDAPSSGEKRGKTFLPLHSVFTAFFVFLTLAFSIYFIAVS